MIEDRWFGNHICEAWAVIKEIFHKPERKVNQMMSVSEAAKELIAKLDTELFDDHDSEVEALREALEAEEKAAQDFRAQFTQSGGTISSDPNVKYEIWN
jgi:hypothetical protein